MSAAAPSVNLIAEFRSPPPYEFATLLREFGRAGLVGFGDASSTEISELVRRFLLVLAFIALLV